jgi:photosystem II stability/assembly factor-like uncharacterized protein
MLRRAASVVFMLHVFMFHCSAFAAEPQWVNISDDLVNQLTADGKKPAWPGQTAGIVVDRTNGNVFLVIAGQGLFKSTDHGATFARCDDGKVGGRCETAFSINVDPNSSRLACFMLDGKCGMSPDGGRTWQGFKDVGRNWDFAAVDWTIEKPQVIYGARHESGGEMYVSTNAGQSWTQIDKDASYSTVGVVDANTFLTSKEQGLLRSTDQGKTWAKVSDLTPMSRVMQTFNGAHYFFARPAGAAVEKRPAAFQSTLIVSRDKGATWTPQGTITDAAWGPYFGADEKHVITLGRKGWIAESTDAGQTWKPVIQVPKGFDTNREGWFTNVAYDPKGDTFYVSKMGQPAFKYARK